jgi:hypothetical protein
MLRPSRPRSPPAFCTPLIRLPFACCPPFPVQVPGHGTAFGRRKNSRCPGLTFRHPLLQTRSVQKKGIRVTSWKFYMCIDVDVQKMNRDTSTSC